MLYIPKIGGYLKVMTDNEVEDFVVINFNKYFKSVRDKLYSRLREKQNLRNIVESLFIFLTTPDKVENMLRWCNQILQIIVFLYK